MAIKSSEECMKKFLTLVSLTQQELTNRLPLPFQTPIGQTKLELLHDISKQLSSPHITESIRRQLNERKIKINRSSFPQVSNEFHKIVDMNQFCENLKSGDANELINILGTFNDMEEQQYDHRLFDWIDSVNKFKLKLIKLENDIANTQKEKDSIISYSTILSHTDQKDDDKPFKERLNEMINEFNEILKQAQQMLDTGIFHEQTLLSSTNVQKICYMSRRFKRYENQYQEILKAYQCFIKKLAKENVHHKIDNNIIKSGRYIYSLMDYMTDQYIKSEILKRIDKSERHWFDKDDEITQYWKDEDGQSSWVHV